MLYVGFIFHNSMTPADVSSAQSGFVLGVLLRMVQALGMDGIGITEHLVRKSAHFAEYTLLGLLLYQCLRSYDMTRVVRWQVHILLGFFIPFVDETIQLFTMGRSGQISDVWLDCGGTAFGTLIFAILVWLKKRKRKTVEEKL